MRRTLVLLALMVLATGCAGEDDIAFTLLMRGEHPLEHAPGDVYILGGQVTAGEASKIDGSIYLVDGRLAMNGFVAGDIFVLGGDMALGPAAVVMGDLRLTGEELELSPEATIGGQVVRGGAAIPLNEVGIGRDPWDSLISWLAAALPLAAVGYWLGQRAPLLMQAVSSSATRHALVSAAVGALSALVLPALLVAMVFTIVLIPIALVLTFAIALVLGYGYIAIGWEIGRQARRVFNLSPGAATTLGTLLLMLGLYTIGLLPLAGLWVELLFSVVILGAVFLTRFGTRPFAPVPLENAEL